MKNLANILESILDIDLDVTEQDVVGMVLCKWIKAVVKQKWPIARAALLDIIRRHNLQPANPMITARSVKQYTVIRITDADDGLPTVQFMTNPDNPRHAASQVRLDWLGRENTARISSLDKENIVSISNKRAKPSIMQFLAPQGIFDQLFDAGAEARKIR